MIEPSLSKRIASLAPSPTLALNTKAKTMAAGGMKVINLSVGEPDLDTPAPIVDVAVASLKKGRTKYGASGGGPALRKAIATKMWRDQQLQFSPQEIVAGIGAKEILMHLMMAAFNEGDEVLIPAPYWVSYTSHCEIAGATAVPVPMPDSGSLFSPEHLARFASPRTKGIIINSPNNPGGFIASKAELETLGQFLRDKNWWIISDEIYEYLSFDEPHWSMLQLVPELRSRFVLVNGLSKGFSMTGWRVGYACGPSRLIQLVENMQSQSSTCLPGFIEDAACFALEAGRSVFADGIASLKQRRDLATKEAGRITGISYLKPQGAFYLFLDLRARLRGRSSQEFSEFLLEEGKTAMVPGEAFGAPGFIRMSYATSVDNITAGLAAVARCLETF